jgi:hypothetical protein
LGVKSLGARYRELRLGLGSYRRPTRVWSPRGTAGILGVRAQGHAARIRWWGDSHGRRGARPLVFVTRKIDREKGKRKQGRGLT